MKKWLLLCVWLGSLAAFAAGPEPKFPENKWFTNAKGFAEAQELQKQFGADIFLYFSSSYPKDQAGLCSWFEKHGMGQPAVSKYLRGYLKVEVRLPLGKKDEAAMGRYKAQKGPTIMIVKPDGSSNLCKVFDWPGGQPKLLEPNALVELFRSKSSAKYQQAQPAPSPTP